MPPARRSDLLAARLHRQWLAPSSTESPAAIVSWLGAVQSQDYAGAAWAIGQRGTGLTQADVDRAFDAGEILRTHVMRPTWHFVAPADIRWLLALTAPRVHAVGASYLRQCQLTPRLLARCHAVYARALAGGTVLTRLELGAALKRAGIEAAGPRLALITMNAELEAVICSGPRRGKQFTYALLETRAPRANALSKDESLVTLANRYFMSHGPATLRDFAWWSGLTMGEARQGIAAAALPSTIVDGLTFYETLQTLDTGRQPGVASRSASSTMFLPNYDEFLIAYKDRGLSVVPGPGAERHSIFAHQIVIDGRVAGAWQRTITARRASVQIAMFDPRVSARTRHRLASAAQAYGAFLGRAIDLAMS